MRLDREFVRLPLTLDVARLQEEVRAVPEAAWRPHPQGHPGNDALPLIAVGGDPRDDGVAGPMAPTPNLQGLEYVAQVLESLGTVFGRSRLMRLAGRSNATLHVDTNHYWAERVRVHVPILTSPEIEFRCADARVHMEAGSVWIFDATLPHDVVNPTGDQRIHLVADTVGTSAFWDLVAGGAPRHVPHRPGAGAQLVTEQVNASPVMTPWEQRGHLDWVRDAAGAVPAAFAATLRAFAQDWRALWAHFGDGVEGRAAYAQRLDAFARELEPFAGRLALFNGVDAVEMLHQLVIRPAFGPRPRTAAPPAPPRTLDRPLFIVGSPRSGTSMVFETLARSPDAWTVGGESHEVIEGIADLHPAARGWDSNALSIEDTQPAVVEALHARFLAAVRDRDGRPPTHEQRLRLVEKTPKNALRIGFLAAAFPDARFLYVHRDPRPTLASMLEAWRSGRFHTYDPPGWEGPPWSLLLTPGWRALSGRPPAEIVAAQWAAATRQMLDDLDALDPDRWLAVDSAAFAADPQAQVARIAAFAELGWDEPLTAPLPLSRHTLTPPDPDKWRAHEAELTPLVDEELARRSAAALAHDPAAPAAPREPLRSVSTAAFSDLLDELGSAVLATTYQSGKLVVLRATQGRLNTHFRDLPAPMGLALDGDRLAIGTSTGVTEYRNVPPIAERLGAPHDACFVPRRSHLTGDVRVHDVAYAGGELWLVATRFSCLATLDDDHSFVPRWTPPFITRLAAEDRCHLNGLGVRDGAPRYVTMLGMADTAEGWREHRQGALLDVETGEAILTGLSMPHSPRWHDGRLWFLESGTGTLATVDLDAGTATTVARVPGFTRGLAFAGRYAFIGLSLAREGTFFGGLELEHERHAGVWAVDTTTGATVAFVRFEGAVRELFDVAVLPGHRFPEVAAADSTAAQSAFVVPEAAPTLEG